MQIHSKKRYSWFCEILSVLIGSLAVIIGFIFLRYFGVVTPAAAVIVASAVAFYGIFFETKAMDYLERQRMIEKDNEQESPYE